ncbi:MAG: ABC transporter substrate-binding protein [Nocardioides sp.]|uniref:ABC transporter substrate-binding protein n=1 Tax=Nocardioides sp. TaxID=35761 RepID=UPI0039E6B1E6
MEHLRSGLARRSGTVAALAALSLASAACGGSGSETTSDGLHKITTTTMTVTGGHWRELVAQQKGFFKEHGLQVDETTVSPQVSVDALISGSADLGLGDTAKLVQVVEKGGDVEIVGQGVDRSGNSFVTAKDITRISQLKGKTIGLANDVDPYNTIVDKFLTDGGVDPSEVHFVYGQGSSDRAGALQGGAIQATLLPPPTDSSLEKEGYHILGKTLDVAPLMSRSSILANTSWAKSNPDLVKDYLAALHEAAEWLYDPANKKAAIKMLSADTDTSQADAEEAYQEYVVAKQWDTDTCVNTKAIKNLLASLKQLDAVDDTDPSTYMTTAYC